MILYCPNTQSGISECFVINLIYTPDSDLIDTYPTVVDGRSCKPRLSFVWSHLSAPVKLSTRYTTADIVLETGSTSAIVEQSIEINNVQLFPTHRGF